MQTRRFAVFFSLMGQACGEKSVGRERAFALKFGGFRTKK
jgi:hypothetical protein